MNYLIIVSQGRRTVETQEAEGVSAMQDAAVEAVHRRGFASGAWDDHFRPYAEAAPLLALGGFIGPLPDGSNIIVEAIA